jgi:predicted RNA polymerase sigma factor
VNRAVAVPMAFGPERVGSHRQAGRRIGAGQYHHLPSVRGDLLVQFAGTLSRSPSATHARYRSREEAYASSAMTLATDMSIA